MKKSQINIFILIVCFCAALTTISAANINVSTIAALQTAINNGKSSDVIILADGTYLNNSISIGTSNITVKAGTAGGVFLNGTNTITISGNYVTFSGFQFTSGTITGNVISVTGSNNDITQLNFNGYSAQKYIVLNAPSQYNVVSFCNFENKPIGATAGNLIHIDPSATVPGYHKIRYCSFQNMQGIGGDNGNECIRISNGATSTYVSRTTVEFCYFNNTGLGDSETISNKCRENVIRYNTVVNNQDAWFCFRNGDNCVAYGNFFIGAGGIRLKEANNIYCYNNYFENAGVGGNADAVTLVYYTVNTTNVLNNINFTHNTFVNCGNIDMGGVGATSNTWANNIFKKTSGSIFSNANSGTTYAGNIYNGSLGISIPSGMTSTDPKLVKNAIGYYAPSATSPVIDAASASYPAILDIASIDDDPSLLLDISGITRSASAILKDVGCSEYSTGTTINHPLVLSEVGPSFLIIKANQTITFSAIASKQTGIDDFDPGALASSSLSVSYASSNPLVATIVNGKIHIVGAGNSTITASQIGNTSFNAATNVNQTLTVIQAPKINQTITFNVLPKKTTIDADFDAGATTSSSLAPRYSSSNTSVATIVNGLIHIVGSGMTTITASQSGNASYNAATDVSQSLSVSDVSSTSITLNPIADSYIFGGATTTNNGTLADLYLKKGSGTTGDRIIYLQFDISGQNIYTISSAKVRLYANSVPSAYTITVSQTTDNWTETGITYASCPAKGTDISSVSVTAAGAYYEWDVTSYIQSQFNSNDNIISLVFNDLSASGVIDKFNSKEATANTPQLYVTLNKLVTTDPAINDNNLRMFINAGATLATFDYFLEKESKVMAQMYALNGQQVKSIINNENQHAGKNQKTVDISELKSGIYIIRFKANIKSRTIKFLIVK